MKARIGNVLFDLDGTLTDSRDGIVNSTIWAFEHLGLRAPAASEIEIGPPILQTIEKFIGPNQGTRYVEVVQAYRKRYSEKGVYECKVYSGIEAMLSRLREASIPVFVATSKPTVFAKKILNHFKIENYFTGIYGSELDGSRTDKAELIFHLMNIEQLKANSVVMIGDRKHDVMGARKCGISAIGAGWGYGSVQELLTAGASIVCNRPEDLLPHLTSEE